MKTIKQTIEALLFSSSEPVSLKKLHDVIETVEPLKKSELLDILREMQEEYLHSERAFQMDEIAEGFQLRTKSLFSAEIEHLHKGVKKEKISPAASEVLAIIAFRQPVTRAEIDEIRGVDSSAILATLQERELVEAVGKLEVAGRPTQFGTTRKFLMHYGLSSLEELKTVAHGELYHRGRPTIKRALPPSQ